MEKLPFSEIIKRACGQREEPADYLKLACCYEVGDWKSVSEMAGKIGVSDEKIPQFYLDAVAAQTDARLADESSGPLLT
jgi:c-di-GMP-related signal transduction protein